MFKLILTAAIFCLFCVAANAQDHTISGQLQDINAKGIPYASVSLSSKADTTTLQFAIAKEDGTFTMKKVEKGEYFLVVACIGYDVLFEPIGVSSDIKNKEIVLTSSTISMKEVMVRAKGIPVLMNGDTVVYNSSSFKTQSNANVEDLIRKMPGIQVGKDGKVSAEGQEITRVLINGKEFFGGNVEAATKNLDASLVDKVEVIDKKTDDDEFTGEEGNEREKVINLVLKENKAQGYFGTIRAGYGTGDYYDAKGNINFFKDATQISIIGGLNNINKNIYGWKERATLNSFEINPFNGSSSSWNWNGGVSAHEGIGANVHIEPLKGMKTDIAYVVTAEHNVREGDKNMEVYLTDNTLFSDELSTSGGDKNNHQVNAKMEYEPDTLNRIVWRAQFNKELGVNVSRMLTTNFYNPDTVINSGATLNQRDNGNQKFITKLHWTHKAKKKMDNRFMGSVYYGTSQVDNSRQNYFNRANRLLPFPTSEGPNLVQNLSTNENTIATTAAYQIQLSKKWMIRPGINWMVSEYKHDFEWLPSGQERLLSNSPKGSVTAQNLEYYVHLSYKVDSFTTLYIVPELNQSIEDRRFTTDREYQYDFNQVFFIPYMFLRSNKPHKYNFHFNIRANLNRPGVEQMLPVIDSTNPFRTNIGNIQIQNFMTYNNGWRYQRMFGLGKSVFINGWNSFSYRPVINANTVSRENVSVSEVINFKNRIYSNTSAGFTWPIKAIKAAFGTDIDYNFGQSYFLQNSEELRSRNHTVAIGPNLQFNEFDMWSLDLDYRVNYQTGRVGEISNNAFFYHEVDVEFVFTPIDRIEWATSLSMEIYGANNAVGAQTIPILNSELSYFIDKDQRWSLGVRAFDILDKNQNLWRWWSNNSFTQSQSNAVQRFVMGTLTYKIKKPGSKGGEHTGRRGRGHH
jgi:hypothetical protein